MVWFGTQARRLLGLIAVVIAVDCCALASGQSYHPFDDDSTLSFPSSPLPLNETWSNEETWPLDDGEILFAEPPGSLEFSLQEASGIRPPGARELLSGEATSNLIDVNTGPTVDRSPFVLEGTWIPGSRLQSSPGTLEYERQRLRIGYPLRIYPDGVWIALASANHMRLRSSIVLPDSGLRLPGKLWNFNFGTMRIKEYESGWQVGGLLDFGSASDQPFGELRDWTANLLGFVTVPHGPRNAWNFSVYYSPMSQIQYPLPGIAYVWRPSDVLEASIGIPASIRFRPNVAFTLSASYTPLTDVRVEARQALTKDWYLYSRYMIVNETYWLQSRIPDDDRLFIFDQRLVLGVARKLGRGFQFEANAFYTFDRKLFQAEGFFDDRRDLIRIEPGVGYSARLTWTF